MTEPESKSPTPAAADVGSILKQARLRRGQSFEVVFQHTRIPKKFLDALENNRFDEFPAAVYLHGFFKSYCEHLDLDFDPLWDQIHPQRAKAEIPAEPKHAKVSEELVHATAPSSPTQAAPSEKTEAGAYRGYLPFVTVTAIGILSVGALFWLIQKRSQKPPPPPPLSQRPPEALAPITHLPEKMTLRMVFLNESWVSLRCDDHLRFEGRFPSGFTQTWSATKEFTLRTSAPGDLSLELDGKAFPLGPYARNASGEYVIRRP